jgi:hypothetical protein
LNAKQPQEIGNGHRSRRGRRLFEEREIKKERKERKKNLLRIVCWQGRSLLSLLTLSLTTPMRIDFVEMV